MTSDNRDPVLEVAGAITDRETIDWIREGEEDPEVCALEAEFRALEGVATVMFRAHSGTLEPPASPVLWGPLTLLEQIGEGAFGAVYRARDPVLNREVALKLMRPERVTALGASLYLTEARRLARVRHPHVLTVHGADRHDGRVGLWTDLLTGMTLERQLELQGRFGAYEAAVIGLQLCRALAAVHATGLVHLDVKTTNVMREEGGRIVLMDFGAGREAHADESLAGLGGLGTPMTMAPEQLRGERAGPAADIYGLGVLLYRLVTHRYPYEATTVAELAGLQARGADTPLRDARPDLPTEFTRIVERAMSTAPEQRFASAGAMERALAMATGTFTRTELGMAVVQRSPRPVLRAVSALARLLGFGRRPPGQ